MHPVNVGVAVWRCGMFTIFYTLRKWVLPVAVMICQTVGGPCAYRRALESAHMQAMRVSGKCVIIYDVVSELTATYISEKYLNESTTCDVF